MSAAGRGASVLEVDTTGAKDLQAAIAALADLDHKALRRRWRNLHGRAAPENLPRTRLAKVIAYRRQADEMIRLMGRIGAADDGGLFQEDLFSNYRNKFARR